MKKLVAILMAAAFLLAMYVPVSAADWDLYGSARVNTWWTDYSEDLGDDTQLNHNLQGNARIGAFVDAGAIGGRFEYGHGGGNTGLRLLYGTVDMGQGQLLVGQHYTPWSFGGLGVSTQAYNADIGLLQFMAYDGRQPMVQYSVNNFKFALVTPNTTNYTEIVPVVIGVTPIGAPVTGLAAVSTDYNPEVVLPQLQAGYNINMQGVSFGLAGVYQTYKLQSLDDETLNAWGVAGQAKLNMMDPFYINAGGFYGENVSNFGQLGLGGAQSAMARAAIDPVNNEVEDTETYGLALVLGTNLNKVGLQAGVGYRSSDNDNYDDDYESYGLYGQATVPITANGNAFIVPEIGYYEYDSGNSDSDQDEMYAGLKWQVDF